MTRFCVFCAIVERVEPATIRYEDDDVIVFDNVLGWTPVMLLAVPKVHQSQTELWESLGPVGRAAAAMGKEHSPQAFRILSNFGALGMQSQPHGHLHILDGTDPILDPRRDPPRSTVDLAREAGKELLRTEHAVYYDERPLLPSAAPLTALALPVEGEPSQDELWQDIQGFGADLAAVGWSSSPNGFRLVANFPRPTAAGSGERGHVHLLGGAFLGHYV